MKAVEQVGVLGDATRRQIFERLSSGPNSVGELAKGLPVTRSAVSQHLAVLRHAGLVSRRTTGTRNVYYIDPEGVAKLRAYLDRIWESALDEFKRSAEAATKEKPRVRHQ